ncbi:hypothetical protein [Serratia sp. OS31]|uniref:hypothetical protein n=1 Tax=Serratia sp. OS31 TaxID=2760844 RepID=UPI0016019F95|nr:hypothetical protein [Serratia sp. OS31]MBB1585160.1 hypothetical protein [Serratia sp. OS31]
MKSIDFFFIIITALFSSIALSTFGEKPIISFGNVADIVSAFCNIAMAGAAVYAGSKAVNFFKEKAYDHAINLLSKFNELKVDIDMFHFDLICETSLKLPSFHQDSNIPFNLTTPEKNEVLSLTPEKLKELEDRLVILRKQSLNLIVSLNSTKRYGFIMKPEYKERIAFTLSEYNNLTPIHLLNYMRDPKVILLQIMASGKKRMYNDQYNELENLKKILHDTYLEFDNDINNIFIFK